MSKGNKKRETIVMFSKRSLKPRFVSTKFHDNYLSMGFYGPGLSFKPNRENMTLLHYEGNMRNSENI